MIAHLSIAAIVLAMLCALIWGVIPNLARETRLSRPLRAWMDIWLPLLLALPVAVIPITPGATELPAPLRLAVVAMVPLSLAALVVGGALLDRRGNRVQCIDTAHVIALTALGVLLASASIAGRMTDWTGHLLLTAAMLWLWTVSSEQNPADRNAPESSDPVFLVDWTEPLAHPVAGVTQSVMLLVPAVLLLTILSPLIPVAPALAHLAGPAPRSMLALAIAAPLAQGLVLLLLWWRVGPDAAIRCAVSTVILTTLLAVGVLCVRLIPWLSLLGDLRAGVESSYSTTDLTGLSALMLPALLLLGLSATALAHLAARPTRAAMGWGYALAAAATLILGVIQIGSHWPALPKPQPEPAVQPADTPDANGAPPESNSGTFLQDGSI